MIPRLLDSTKTLQELAADRTAGLGSLPETTSCIVTEERNGAYTLTMKLPITAAHYGDVAVGGIIVAKANDNQSDQLFRIQKISRPIGGIVTINANHISYDLNKTSVLPFSAVGAPLTMAGLKTHMTGGSAFQFRTDIANTTSTYTNTFPQSLRACLGGQEGSVLDTFGGEYEWNNLTVFLHAARGLNRGVTLRYGKNITDIQQDETIENMYTAVMPYALDQNGEAVLGSLQIMVESAEPKILNLDLSSRFNGTDNEPTAEKINQYAQAYIQANDLTTPRVSIRVSFVNLAQTEEYKDLIQLERVQLCDTITVQFEKLGISAVAKIVTTKYNTLTERYDEIEVGDARSTLARTINGITDEIKTVTDSAAGYLDNTITAFTSLMANGMGLFVTKEPAPGGGNRIYLHNQPTRAESQYQWTINASGFAVSQDYGQTWAAGIDSEGNAVFNSLAANTVDAMEITGAVIRGGQIVFDPDGNPVTATRGRWGTNGGVEFFGDGDFTVNAATVGIHANGEAGTENEFEIDASDSNGVQRNNMFMRDGYLVLQHKASNGAIVVQLDMRDGYFKAALRDSSGNEIGDILIDDYETTLNRYSSGNVATQMHLSGYTAEIRTTDGSGNDSAYARCMNDCVYLGGSHVYVNGYEI